MTRNADVLQLSDPSTVEPLDSGEALKTQSTDVLRCGPPLPKSVYPEVGDLLLHYQLVGELGVGAFSRVFLASQSDLAGRLVALKVSECADGEPQRLARLQHTNIVPIYSVHHIYQFQVVCMPFVGSHTLATVLKHQGTRPHSTGRELVDTLRNKVSAATTLRDAERRVVTPVATAPPLSPNLELLNRLSHVDAVLWIAARLADGLAHAHERGILHCDLKPHNVLLSDEGQPMLLDFNVSIDAIRGRQGIEFFGGTVPYMAPEHLEAIISGRLNIDARADLYSLGVILYQLLTGHDPHDLPPVRPRDVPANLLRVRSCAPGPPSRWNRMVTPAVDAIVLKLLAPDPAQRYACAADLRDDLERHLADRPLLHAPNTSLVERARKWRRRNPRLAAALAVGTAAVVLLLAPAAVLAVRQDQIAKRRLEVQRVEAMAHRTTALEQTQTAQVLLSTQNGNRAMLDEGFSIGRRVLQEYGIGRTADWYDSLLFSLLPPAEQDELRNEFGELLLLMARGELLQAPEKDPTAARAALEWNRLAEACFPANGQPRWLSRQREELLGHSASEITEPVAFGLGSKYDPYHDGLQEAVRGRFGEALAQLMPFTDRHPNHFMGWFVRGVSHDGVGQLSDAAAALTVCAALKPDMPWPRFSRGLVRLQQGRHAEAAEDFTEALRLERNPKSALIKSALINRALCREALRDWSGADSDLTAALERGDAPTRAYLLRSRIRRSAGDVAGAERDRVEGLKLAPTDSISWITRGVWRMAADPKGALADLDEALKLNPRSRDAMQNKAVVLADYLDKAKDAVAVMDQLLDMYPAHVEARAGRGVYLARIGDGTGARRDAAASLRDEPTAYRYYQMAGLHAQLSRHEADGKARREAFRLLALAFRTGFADFDLMDRDSDLDPIRKTEEFRTLVAHARALQSQ